MISKYTFYLYNDEGGLIEPVVADLASDKAARDHVLEILRRHPHCAEVEIWITPRYVGQGRRRPSDGKSRSKDSAATDFTIRPCGLH
jgi:hypothetical protein